MWIVGTVVGLWRCGFGSGATLRLTAVLDNPLDNLAGTVAAVLEGVDPCGVGALDAECDAGDPDGRPFK